MTSEATLTLRVSLALAVAAGMAACNSTNVVPPPALPSIQHVVIVMQENRSFNNIFAGFPGAMTAMSGPCVPVHTSSSGSWCESGTAKLKPVTLETTDQLGLGTDIDHSHHGFGVECDLNPSGVCRNDGFDLIRFGEAGDAGYAMLYPYAYIERSESKAYWDFAKRYELADEMFFTDTASSFIAHQMILSGTVRLNSRESLTDQPYLPPWGCDATPPDPTPVLYTNGKENLRGWPFPCFTQYGTLADVLDPANVSWRYYVAPVHGDFSGDVWDGFDAIAKVRCKSFTPPSDCNGYGADWKAHMAFGYEDPKFFADLRSGSLPAVSWVIPTLEDSDHPASGCNHGPRWVTKVVNAVGESKYWDSTAVIVLWDDWGGWYDPAPPAEINYTSLGFRIPLILISPWAKLDSVSHTQYQYGSILKFIEQNFGTLSLHTTDDSSTSIANMFDFNQMPGKYVPEPLPPERSCNGNPMTKQIIEHDGGVPE